MIPDFSPVLCLVVLDLPAVVVVPLAVVVPPALKVGPNPIAVICPVAFGMLRACPRYQGSARRVLPLNATEQIFGNGVGRKTGTSTSNYPGQGEIWAKKPLIRACIALQLHVFYDKNVAFGGGQNF